MYIKFAISYKLYFFFNRIQLWYLKDGHIRCRVFVLAQKFYRWFDKFLMNGLLVYYRNNPVSIQSRREQKLIASLTSYPARIDKIWIAIESIFHQTVKPDKIILWLADSQFPNKMNDLPQNLTELCSRGLEIRFCKDYKSHKKYYYAMKEFPKDIVILFDDDIIYPSDTIRKLLKYHRKYPDSVIGISTFMPSPKISSMPSQWVADESRKAMAPMVTNQVFSGAGSLWPPNSLDKRVFDVETFMLIAPYADDLWLYIMMLLNDTKACRSKRYVTFPHEIIGTQEHSLFQINGVIGGNQNNKQWSGLLRVYGAELKEKYPDMF